MASSLSDVLGLKEPAQSLVHHVKEQQRVGAKADNSKTTKFEQAAASSYDDALSYVMKIIHAENVTPEESRDMTKDVITAWCV